MRPRFLPVGSVYPLREQSAEPSTSSAMRSIAGRRFRSSPLERRAALVHLVGLLQALPSKTFSGEIYPVQVEVAGFLRRHRRRVARIGGLRPGAMRSATFLPLRVTTTGRSRRNTYRSSLDVPVRRSDANLPVYSDVEVECAALMALWVDAWFAKETRKFLVVGSEFAPTCEPVTDILCWRGLPEEWGTDRVEVLETLLADGLRVNEAREIAERL